jgi:hypothetical protein
LLFSVIFNLTATVNSQQSAEFRLSFTDELHAYLQSYGISHHGSREGLIARCEAKEQELAQQRRLREKSQQLNSEIHTEESPTKEITMLDGLPADTRSTSSDRPLPKESIFKRLVDQFIGSQ